MNKLLQSSFEKGISFKAYFDLSKQFAENGKTSGLDQSEAMANYTKLNYSRMKRLVKTANVSDNLKHLLSDISSQQKWLLISETWCGDAAQNLPQLAKMADLNKNIELRIVFRDENLDLMDNYLTKGGRSVPKLIVFNETEELFTWGPRPQAAQDMVNTYKSLPEPKEPYSEFVITLQKWYNDDAGLSLDKEIRNLLHKKSPVN